MNFTSNSTLEGEVYYLERIGLPSTAILEVFLLDVSRADAPAITLAKQSGQIKGQIPLPFCLTYDPAEVEPGHSYEISARIENNGRLLFTTTTHNPVDLNADSQQPIHLLVNIVAN